MKVIFTQAVLDYLENLVIVLYQREYFGFLDSSSRYVEELLHSIRATLPMCVHKPAPSYFDYWGENMEYAVFKKSKHTSWYAFFRVYWENGEEIFQVRYIANNHIIAQHL
jgi:hypothetical protein